MSNVDTDPEAQIDPEVYANDGDLWVDEGIVLPPNSPYRRPRHSEGNEYDFDGMDGDLPDFMSIRDPLFDNDW